VPRRQHQEPQLPVTFAGGCQLPNSEAEGCQLPNSEAEGNGNYNNDSNPDADPDASAQHMERARSPPGSQLLSSTMANPNGQATQNSVQTLPQLAHQAPQLRELNDEFLLAYNSLIPNSEYARLHQQMIQERRQQQQLAREEAAKLKERVKTALAKAIGWAIAASSRPDLDQADPLPVPTTGGPPGGGSQAPVSTKTGSAALATAIAASSRPDLDQADPLPVPTTGGSPGGGSTAPISTKPGSAAASQPLNQTLANPKGLANQNMVPQTNPNLVPQTSNTLAHQANPIRQLPNNDFLKGRVETALAKAIAASSRPDLDQTNPLPVPTTGGSPGGGSPAPVSSKPGSSAAQHQSGEGNQGLNLEMSEINPEIHPKLPKKVEIFATKNRKIPTNFNVQ
jgi:hypothetical protein